MLCACQTSQKDKLGILSSSDGQLYERGLTMVMFRKVLIMFALLFWVVPQWPLASVINPNKVYTYHELSHDIEKLEKAYPHAISSQSIGTSYFGREIWAVKLGNGSKHILITGAHHGREWLTSNLIMKMMDLYADAYTNKRKLFGIDSRLLDEISIWFIPMMNPDGVTIQQSGIDTFPLANQLLLLEMNENNLHFKRWKANGVGIDLNRQYPAGWKEINGDSATNSYQFYKGRKPIEAVEVRALVNFTRKIKPLLAISYHTSGREIYWYYNNDKNVIKRDKKIAEKLSKMTGYPLNTPPKHAIGGGYTDWFIQTFKRPGFTIEISYPVHETNPPLTVLEEEWQRNKKVGIIMANMMSNMMSDIEKRQNR